MGGRPKTEGDFPQNKVSQIKMGATGEGGGEGGDGSLWGTSGLSAFDNTVVLARFAALAHVLAWRKITFHLMEHTKIGGAKGFSGFFELEKRIREDVRAAWLNSLAGRTHLETLAIRARSGTV